MAVGTGASGRVGLLRHLVLCWNPRRSSSSPARPPHTMRTNLFLPTILLTALASRAPVVTIPCLLAAGLATTASAATLPTSREFTNSIGMKFVPVRPGQFVMGCGAKPPTNEAEWKARDWDESPAHKVRITTSFFLSAYEVTNAQYERFDPEHKKLRGMFGVSKADNEPVTMVTWQQAVEFCQWLSKRQRRPYRLPTEAEWEYACRAGTSTVYNTGEKLPHQQANIGLCEIARRRSRLSRSVATRRTPGACTTCMVTSRNGASTGMARTTPANRSIPWAEPTAA